MTNNFSDYLRYFPENSEFHRLSQITIIFYKEKNMSILGKLISKIKISETCIYQICRDLLFFTYCISLYCSGTIKKAAIYKTDKYNFLRLWVLTLIFWKNPCFLLLKMITIWDNLSNSKFSRKNLRQFEKLCVLLCSTSEAPYLWN